LLQAVRERITAMRQNSEFRRMQIRLLALAVAILLWSSSLLGQATDQKKKESTSAEENPTSVSIAVDSGRKASDLPPAIDTADNEGERWGTYEVRQSAEFGGRI